MLIGIQCFIHPSQFQQWLHFASSKFVSYNNKFELIIIQDSATVLMVFQNNNKSTELLKYFKSGTRQKKQLPIRKTTITTTNQKPQHFYTLNKFPAKIWKFKPAAHRFFNIWQDSFQRWKWTDFLLDNNVYISPC